MNYKVSDFEKEIDEIINLANPYLTVDTVFGDGAVPQEVYGLLTKAFKLKKMGYEWAEEQEKMIDTYKEKIDELETRGKELNNKLDRVLRLLEAQQKKD